MATRSTRISLLARVRDLDDDVAWRRFYSLYGPLLVRFARRSGLGEADALEVRDQCLEILTREMPGFEYDPVRGSFKSFLQRVARAKVIDLRRRRRGRAADTASWRAIPDEAPTPDEHWERAWEHEHLLHCLELVRDDFSPRDFQAFQLLLLHECSVEEVGQALSMNANQVYKARSRILARVREKLRTLEAS